MSKFKWDDDEDLDAYVPLTTSEVVQQPPAPAHPVPSAKD
jgi:hypothetical protein